jgi:hypothetical protein
MAPVLNPAELPAPATCVSWYKSAGSSAPSAPASMCQRVTPAPPGGTPGACTIRPDPDRHHAAFQASVSTSPHAPDGTPASAEPQAPAAATGRGLRPSLRAAPRRAARPRRGGPRARACVQAHVPELAARVRRDRRDAGADDDLAARERRARVAHAAAVGHVVRLAGRAGHAVPRLAAAEIDRFGCARARAARRQRGAGAHALQRARIQRQAGLAECVRRAPRAATSAPVSYVVVSFVAAHTSYVPPVEST